MMCVKCVFAFSGSENCLLSSSVIILYGTDDEDESRSNNTKQNKMGGRGGDR